MSEPKLGGKLLVLPSQVSFDVLESGGGGFDVKVSVGKREGSVTLPVIHF